MHITLVAGARPNFIKIAPIVKAFDLYKEITYDLIHTGQHFDYMMSESFFNDLQIPSPKINLNCGGGSHSEQTAAILVEFEKYLLSNPTDLVMVVGDVNSTMACTIVARKLQIKVAHVEAGIRSNDWSMPEEINRVVTDSISNYFFTTSEIASQNLRNQGISEDQIFFVGNTMIDTLLTNKQKFIPPDWFSEKQLSSGNYIVLTLHRPSNVDNPNILDKIIKTLLKSGMDLPIIFPVHPRTQSTLSKLSITHSRIILAEPMGYFHFNYLVQHSKCVVTDSGGITEETTVLGIPCITLRSNTERPETVSIGTNELVGNNWAALEHAFTRIMNNNWKSGTIPPLWDGRTSERIAEILFTIFSRKERDMNGYSHRL